MKSQWEDVCSPHENDYLERIEVPGGWIYRCWMQCTTTEDGDVMTALAMTFVPNPMGHK